MYFLLLEGSLYACFISYSYVDWAQMHELLLATEKLYSYAVIKNSLVTIQNEEDPLIWRICLEYEIIYRKCVWDK